MVARILGLLLAVFVMHITSPAAAQTVAEPMRYTLRFPEPHTHYVEVTAVVPTGGRPAVELMMAVWTPGSYMVREYSRHVEAVTASAPDGRSLDVEKSDKNRWRIVTGGAASVSVSYRVYAREMSVRTNWVETDFAMLNGAPTFMTLADGGPRPHEVTIEPARGWQASLTGLPEMPGGPHRYRAPDFDTLVDSPIVVGNPAVHEFTVSGKKHYLVNVGEAGTFEVFCEVFPDEMRGTVVVVDDAATTTTTAAVTTTSADVTTTTLADDRSPPDTETAEAIPPPSDDRGIGGGLAAAGVVAVGIAALLVALVPRGPRKPSGPVGEAF